MNLQIFCTHTENRLHSSKPLTSDRKFIHAFLTYTGAFLFAIILIVMVHEIGHFLAFHWCGYDAVSIRINPFMGTTSCKQDIQTEDAVFIVLGGTIFNLSLAAISAITLRWSKSSYWMPVKMYSAMAFLIEGMVIVTGMFFDEVVTDFAWLINFGWTPIFVGFIGIIFIIIGGYLKYEIWILTGIHQKSPPKLIFLLNSPYFLYCAFGVLLGQVILPIEMSFFKKFMAVGMVLHWLYLGIRIYLTPVIMPRIWMRMTEDIYKVTVNSSRFSMILGCASWVLSFLVLN